MVSTATLVTLGITGAICLTLPIVLLIVYYRSLNISLKAAGWGALGFFVFAMVLEGIVHYFVFSTGGNGPGGLLSHPLAFALYGGLMAGLFEESARFIVYKKLIPKQREWKDGLAYGLGHGGIEMILLGGLNLVAYLVMLIIYNKGTAAIPEAAIQPILETPWWEFGIVGVERIMALVIQIALSIFLLYGIRNNRNIYLLYAILLHALLNFAPAFYQKGVLNIYVTEGIILLLGIACLIYVVRSKKLFGDNNDLTSHTSQQTF